MKGVIVKLTLGKRDNIIKAWINLILRQGGNFSRSVDYAITYFARTGDYLDLGNIGTIGMLEGNIDIPPKNIYFAQNSPAVAWLAERKRDGEKEATAIKRVLRRCLTQNEEEVNRITGIDDLYDMVQAARKEKGNEPEIVPNSILETSKNEEKNKAAPVAEKPKPLTEESPKEVVDDFTERFTRGFTFLQ